VNRTVFTGEHSPRAIIVVVGGALLVGLVRHLWLEGALDVVLHEPALPERVLDGDLVVWARRVQELLEVVHGRCGLALVALGARSLAFHRRDKVVVATMLVVLLLLFEARGGPLTMVCDLLPLSLGVFSIAGTASSPSVWLLAMSRSSRVVRGIQRPSRWMREVHIVPF
jgi:hypothetical protein